jgi:subtilisin family serine protease
MTTKRVLTKSQTLRGIISIFAVLSLLLTSHSALAASSMQTSNKVTNAERAASSFSGSSALEKTNNGKSLLENGNGKSGMNGNPNNGGNNGNLGRDKGSTKINDRRSVGINIVLKGVATPDIFAQISKFGTVTSIIHEINALTLKTESGNLNKIRNLDFVKSANEDASRNIIPVVSNSSVDPSSLTDGFGSWNLDMINITDGTGDNTRREVDETGAGTYVAVIDTGLLKTWRAYFDESSIASEFGAAFGGGGGERGTVSTQPNKWELDQDSHGTHVTSTILGFKQPTRTITGVAPGAKVIPVKALGQNGSGWSSVVAAGITYVANLKAGPLSGSPVIINMSLGGSTLDGMEQVAIDYAISVGVIVVASAGNIGEGGMGYPGAYAPVISVAAAGWTGEWTDSTWWRNSDVAENGSDDAYITDFSSRELAGQELDVAAPGSWIVGPYQTNGQLSWYFLGGTSMASPHVAGLAALMMQKNGTMNQSTVEQKLKSSTNSIAHRSAEVRPYLGQLPTTISWGDDAVGFGLVDAVQALAAIP